MIAPLSLSNLLANYYGLHNPQLTPMQTFEDKPVYKVEQPGRQPAILRCLPAENQTLAETARLLTFLEEQHYPAEQIIPTTAGTALATLNGFHALMTGFIAGTAFDYTPAAFEKLGATLGRLHSLALPTNFTLPRAGMLPSNELAFAQQQLDAVAGIVPEPLHAHYKLLYEAVTTLDRCENLPLVLIHNDYHPNNAILTNSGVIKLIDWDGAGAGPAILDLGFLLSNCDGAAPWTPLPENAVFQPDKARIVAVSEGYSLYRHLNEQELRLLPDAIRFRAIVYGACSFANALIGDKPANQPQYWWYRFSHADEIAEIASTHF